VGGARRVLPPDEVIQDHALHVLWSGDQSDDSQRRGRKRHSQEPAEMTNLVVGACRLVSTVLMLMIVRCCGAVRRNCHTPDGEMERGEQRRVREQRQQSERSRGIAPSTQSDGGHPRPVDWFHGYFGPML
jgi:hypothetical protein